MSSHPGVGYVPVQIKLIVSVLAAGPVMTVLAPLALANLIKLLVAVVASTPVQK